MEVKYLGAYIVGLRITCSYSNNGIESFSWEEKKSVPEKTSCGDDQYMFAIVGAAYLTSSFNNINGIKLFYKVVDVPGVEHADYFSTWGGKSDLPFAILSSPIRGIVN